MSQRTVSRGSPFFDSPAFFPAAEPVCNLCLAAAAVSLRKIRASAAFAVQRGVHLFHKRTQVRICLPQRIFISALIIAGHNDTDAGAFLHQSRCQTADAVTLHLIRHQKQILFAFQCHRLRREVLLLHSGQTIGGRLVLILQVVYGRTQSAFSEDGLQIGAGLEDLGKGTRSMVGTTYGTLAKGPRYLDLTEGYITQLALDEDDEIIGYKYLNFGKMMDFIKAGDDPATAVEKASGQYGRVADAVKLIDPRKE